MRLFIYLLIFFTFSCNDSSVKGEAAGDDSEPRLILNSPDAGAQADIPIIQTDPPPPPPEPELTREERCAQTTIQETQAYCSCFPDCCDRQRWYCPPNPRQTIDVMQVILEVYVVVVKLQQK